MPTILNLKPEEVDTTEKRSKYTVSVVGCGHKGIVYANAFAEAGFSVICTDANASVAKKVAKGKTALAEAEVETKLKNNLNKGQISVSNERKKAVSQSDVIIIAVGARIDDQKKPDYSQVISAAKQVGAGLHQGAIIIYCGIAGFGFVEGTFKETLENTSALRAGIDFGLVYNPVWGQNDSLANIELKIAGINKSSQDAAAILLKTFAKKVKELGDIKTAEAVALFALSKKDANRALANELAVFCENANLNFFEILKQLDDVDSTFDPAIVEGEPLEEAFLLLDSAENINTKLRFPILARTINEDMVKHAVNLTQNALRTCNKTLRRAKVAVLGTANPASSVGSFVKMLEMKGAKVSLYDFQLKGNLKEWGLVKNALSEAVEGTDCIVILSGQEHLKNLNLRKLKTLMKAQAAIVDLTGSLDSEKVKTEGFIYFGFGKGIDGK